jgi:hypothetical protein
MHINFWMRFNSCPNLQYSNKDNIIVTIMLMTGVVIILYTVLSSTALHQLQCHYAPRLVSGCSNIHATSSYGFLSNATKLSDDL